MTSDEKIEVLITMAGWTLLRDGDFVLKDPDGRYRSSDEDPNTTLMDFRYIFPKYLEEYDAIIPLINKMCIHVYRWLEFESQLLRIMDLPLIELSPRYMLQATPEQLADALIKTMKKWKD